MAKFYEFRQNNSGGVFVKFEGGKVNIVVEADSAEQANEIAQEHGVYFGGVREGRDCSCCGDRWNAAYQDWDVIAEEEIDDESFVVRAV